MKTIKYDNRVETYNDKDELHSFNDNPAVDCNNGYKAWCKEGKFHRLDGPAIRYSDGGNFWCKEGELHRIDGPAIEYSDGDESWHYEGKEIECKSTKEFLKIIKLKVFW